MSTNERDAQDRPVIGFVGVGLDHKDGEHRLTRSEQFYLVGGSSETHDKMQDTATKLLEALKRRGQDPDETDMEDIIEVFYDDQE